MHAPQPLGRSGRVENFSASSNSGVLTRARALRSCAHGALLVAAGAIGVPAGGMLLSVQALAANECGNLAAGANTKDCQGSFTNGIEYGPTSTQGPLILNLGDGSIPNAAAVTAPTAFGFGQYGVVVGGPSGSGLTAFPSPITIPVVGAQVDVTVNVNPYSQVQGTAGGVFVWTDGTGNDATINNYGTVLATGLGTGSLGIGLNAVAGNPLANPLGSGNAVANNFHEVNAKGNGINAWSEAGSASILNGIGATVTSSNGNGLSTLDPLLGLTPTGGIVTVQNGGSVSAKNIGIVAASLGQNVTVDGVQPVDITKPKVYGSVVTTGGPGVLALTAGSTAAVTVDTGAVTSGSGGFSLPSSFGGLSAFSITGGVLAGSLGSGAVTVTTHGKTSTSGYFGVAGLSLSGSSSVTIKDDVVGNLTAPLVTTLPVIGGASIVLGGTKNAALNLDAGKTVNASGIGLFATNAGSGEVTIAANAASTVNSDALGIVGLGVQNGNVTVDAGNVNISGSGSFTPLGLGYSLNGGVLGASLGSGNVLVNTNGVVHVQSGLFGAAAYSSGGSATLNINAMIDPALIGGIAITGGAMDATANVNALTQGTLLGVLAGNFGNGGNVNVNVIDHGGAPNTGSVESDGIGILAFKTGNGDVNVDLAGAVKGIGSNAATGDDGVNIDYGLGNGNINVATHNNYDYWSNPAGHAGTINAGDDGIEINRLAGTGNIGLMLGANITAKDNGISIFRAAGAGNNYVDVGIDFGATPSESDDVLKPMDIVATHGNGITVVNLATDGSINANPDVAETNIEVYRGSTVTADNGSAVAVLTTSLLGSGNHNVYLGNAGTLTGDGGLFSPTVGVATTGSFFTGNWESGVVTTDGNQPYALIYGVAAGGHVGIENHGVMTGAMALGSLHGGIDVDNVYGSGGIWNTSGLNTYASFDDINLNNNKDGYGNNATINAEGLTVFTFATPGHAGVNNAGVFNVVDLGSGPTIPGAAVFVGLDDFNNSVDYGADMRGGILDMRNGISSYFLSIPTYGTGIGNAVFMAGASFNGGPGSALGVDAFLAGDTAFGGSVNSSADLLVAKSINHGYGGAPTTVWVHDTNPGPGEYNPQGIPVVGVLSGETKLGDFTLGNGPINKGLFTYGLFLDTAPLYTPPGHDDAAAWVLASYPNSSATALAQSLNIINNMWDTTASGWIDRSGDLRGLYGSGGGGGSDLALPGASKAGPNANGTWARAIGNWGSRNDSSTIQPFADQPVSVAASYDESLWAIEGGVDHAFQAGKGTIVVGVMGGYEANSVNFSTPGDSANYTAPMAGIYASYIDGPAYVDALFKADFLKADLNIGGDDASTDGTALGGRIEAGYRYKMNGGWFFEPVASLAYVNTQLDSTTVAGTPVTFNDGDSLRGEVGFRSGGAFANGNLLYQPYVTASLGNEFLGDNSVFLASGPGVTVTDNVRGVYGKVGAGINVTNLGKNVTTYLQGTYMFADSYQSGSAKGGIRVNW